MKIAVYNEKGGSGKTTTTVAIAIAMGLPVLDLDPQATATHWLSRREPPMPKFHKADVSWVADCPPGINQSLTPTLAVCDLVLIPVRASFPDLVTLPATIKFLRANTAAKLAFICSDIDRRTSDESMLKESLAAHQLPVAGVLAHRASYRRAGIEGKLSNEVDPAAVAELNDMITNIKELLK